MGLETVGILMIGTAIVLACRVLQVPAAIPLLVVMLALMQVGALQAAAVPGLAQIANAKAELDHWADERVENASGDEATSPSIPVAPPA